MAASCFWSAVAMTCAVCGVYELMRVCAGSQKPSDAAERRGLLSWRVCWSAVAKLQNFSTISKIHASAKISHSDAQTPNILRCATETSTAVRRRAATRALPFTHSSTLCWQ